MTTETTTQHFGWTKPVLSGSPTTWGQFLNQDLDSIDALIYANQQGLVPIGALTMWPTTTPPANWLLCNGQSLAHTTGGAYEALFKVIGYTYGGSGASFNVPNLTQKFPLGAGSGPGTNAPGASGGSFYPTIQAANLPAHAHGITDVTHNHTVNQAAAHTHADAGHTHTATEAPHTHTVGGTSGSAGSGFAAGAGATVATTTTSSAQPAITVVAAAANIQPTAITVSLNPSKTGITTTQPFGSATPTPMTVIPPWVALYFIIRFQ